MSYPAINGYTLFHDVSFFGFQNICGKRHRAIMTNSWVGDILHPMDVRGLLRIYHFMYTFSRVSSSQSLFLLLAKDFAFAFSFLYLTIAEAEYQLIDTDCLSRCRPKFSFCRPSIKITVWTTDNSVDKPIRLCWHGLWRKETEAHPGPWWLIYRLCGGYSHL